MREPMPRGPDRPRAHNSTLPRATKGLERGAGLERNGGLERGRGPRTRSFRERWKDRPDVYGPVWEAAKLLPCFALQLDRRHRCALGHTAHHFLPVGNQGTDLDGLLPCCELIHRWLHGEPGRTLSDFLVAHRITLAQLETMALGYVQQAMLRLGEVEELEQ